MGAWRGEPRFNFVDRSSPDYEPSYGKTYTARQRAILEGDIPLEQVRANDLTVIMRKSLQMGDTENYEVARELLRQKTEPNDYVPPYTIQEAKEILQRLTPWEIDWGGD